MLGVEKTKEKVRSKKKNKFIPVSEHNEIAIENVSVIAMEIDNKILSNNDSENTIENASINTNIFDSAIDSVLNNKNNNNFSSVSAVEIVTDIENENAMENVTEIENETINKINNYRKMVSENENKKTFNDIYEQQNVYIDRHLIKAVDKIIRQKGKKKKDIYNEALQMYLDIMYDQQIKLKGE